MAANPPKTEFHQRPLSDLGGVGRHRIRKKTFFPSGYVLGGPNPVSKALERCQRLHVRRRKPAFGTVNPLNLPLIPLASVLSAFPL
jgi:hypothetical protein